MKKILTLMMLVFILFLTGCENNNDEEINIDTKAESITQVKMTSGKVNIDVQAPFDNHTNEIVNNITSHISSLTFLTSIVDEGECDGGNDIRYHLYTNQQDHFELYDISASKNEACTSYLIIKKNDEILGYPKTESNTLNELFLNLQS